MATKFKKQTAPQRAANAQRGETKINAVEKAVDRGAYAGMAAPKEPLFFRLPPAGEVDPWFGLNRSAWYVLITPNDANNNKPPVRARQLKLHGDQRGIWCVNFKSARHYFDQGDLPTSADVDDFLESEQKAADVSRQ